MSKQIKAVAAAVVAIGFVAYIGNYHVIYGGGIGMQKIEKVSWSLGETIINLDELRELPLIAVRIKYPLFLQAGVREGFLTLPKPP